MIAFEGEYRGIFSGLDGFYLQSSSLEADAKVSSPCSPGVGKIHAYVVGCVHTEMQVGNLGPVHTVTFVLRDGVGSLLHIWMAGLNVYIGRSHCNRLVFEHWRTRWRGWITSVGETQRLWN